MILWVSGRGRRLTYSLAPGETAPPTGPNRLLKNDSEASQTGHGSWDSLAGGRVREQDPVFRDDSGLAEITFTAAC